MTTTAKRSNDDSTGTPAPKRSATDTATSVVDANWKELDFGKPFANKYDGFHIGFGIGDARNRLTLQMSKPLELLGSLVEGAVGHLDVARGLAQLVV